MSRGYRSIIVALVGWLILCSSSPKQQAANSDKSGTQNSSAGALQNIAVAIQQANKGPEPDPGCERGQDDRYSDLCAQWKAADAAKDSADWTRRTFWLALLGTVIGGLTLSAAAFAAWYAREAAKHTMAGANEAKRAADAAFDGLGEARNNMRLEYAATLVVIDTSITFNETDLSQPFFHFHVENIGRSSAQNVKIGTSYRVENIRHVRLAKGTELKYGFVEYPPIQAGKEVGVHFPVIKPLTIMELSKIKTEEMAIFIYVIVQYRDIFDIDKIEEYQFGSTSFLYEQGCFYVLPDTVITPFDKVT